MLGNIHVCSLHVVVSVLGVETDDLHVAMTAVHCTPRSHMTAVNCTPRSHDRSTLYTVNNAVAASACELRNQLVCFLVIFNPAYHTIDNLSVC